MDMPSLMQVLAEFTRVPHRFVFDYKIYKETWEWALDVGLYTPEPTFSADDLPVLCWAAVIDEGDEDFAPVYLLPSGIVVV